MNGLSAAELRLIECMKVAIMGRKGLGIDPKDVDGHYTDFATIMSDAKGLADWVEAMARDAASVATVDAVAGERLEAGDVVMKVPRSGDDPSALRDFIDERFPKPGADLAGVVDRLDSASARSIPRIPARTDGDDAPPPRNWNMTAEQIDWLDAKYGHMAKTTEGRIAAFYWYARKHHLPDGNDLPMLPHIDECPIPCRQDQLAVDSAGVVHRYSMNAIDVVDCRDGWRVVDTFPGFRVEHGVLHWAPGVWPPAMDSAAAVTSSGERAGFGAH